MTAESEVATILKNHYGSNFAGFYSRFFQEHRKVSGNEWSVRCPFHDDKVASLSLSLDTGLYHCHACGESGNFIQFFMKHRNLDYVAATREMCAEAGLQFPESRKSEPAQKPRLVKEYDYTDEMGGLKHQTLRYEPKDFRQRSVNGLGGWNWTLKGVKTYLYNLSAVLNADRVFLMEGEKDCDTATEMGLTATTCPMGAGAWRGHYDTWLKGREVILMPDNDKPGIQHMINVGKRLDTIADVRWLEYPDRHAQKKGFDFTDFINQFGNEFLAMDEFDGLVRAARKFDPAKIIIPEPDTDLSNSIKEWILTAPGEFSIRDIDYDMGFKTVDEKQNRTRILEKFVAEKVISREGTRRGVYRPYRSELERMDFMNAADDFLPIWMPFKMHDLVGLLPGNIVIVAGEPNAGKTALMLNIIKANRHKFNVHYFNSEMGGGELKNRLSKFEDIGLGDWKFNAYSRDDNFADVIFQGPKNLNIVDFLEVHDNFYLVGEKIKQIHSALNGAIAIIALQRNSGSEFGLGGQRTMEKARLVMNVSPGKLKITKAKNFIRPDVNPNGMEIKFKLVQGCKLIVDGGGWYKSNTVEK